MLCLFYFMVVQNTSTGLREDIFKIRLVLFFRLRSHLASGYILKLYLGKLIGGRFSTNTRATVINFSWGKKIAFHSFDFALKYVVKFAPK